MDIDDSIEIFGFSLNVLLVSTRRRTTVSKFSVTSFQCILTPSFVTVKMFDRVVPYCFAILFVHNNYYCLDQNIDKMITFIPIRMCKRHDLS